MRIKAWDLESSSLNASFGIVLCGGIKTVGEGKAKVISLADFKGYKKDPCDDKALVQALRDDLSDCDAWLTWYGTRFDIPMLNTRLLAHRLAPLPPMPHIDGWKVSRNHLKMHSNRLAAVSDFFELHGKTPITSKDWIRACAGNRKALQVVINHCEADIYTLEDAYKIFLPLIPNHPAIRLYTGSETGCPRCGSHSVQKRGLHVATTRAYQRYQCQACGGWFREDKPTRSTKARSL